MLAGAAGVIGCGVGPGAPGAITQAHPSAKVTGSVHGGQQPVAGAEIFLYAAGTSSGAAAQSLLTTPGGCVFTDAGGNWDVTNDYTCPANSYVYVLAVGGNPGLGSGASNPKLSLAAYLGACSALSATQFVSVNEITTVVAASALAGHRHV